MSTESNLTEVEPKAAKKVPTAAQISSGIPVPPVRLLQTMSPWKWGRTTVNA